MNQIGAVCCHFNFAGFKTRTENYHQFRQGIESVGVELLTIECVAPGRFAELAHLPNIIVLEGDILWQKERLWQFGAEEMIRRGYDRLVFLDADVIYPDYHWPEIVCRCLDDNLIIHAYEHLEQHFSDRTNHQRSALAQKIDRPARGIAFACRSEFINEVGFYEHFIVGGGDGAIIRPLLASNDDQLVRDLRSWKLLPTKEHRKHYQAWALRCRHVVGHRWGFAPLRITALAHGSLKARHYASRHSMLASFDPFVDVRIEGGAFRWASDKPEMHRQVAEYFSARKEDEK